MKFVKVRDIITCRYIYLREDRSTLPVGLHSSGLGHS